MRNKRVFATLIASALLVQSFVQVPVYAADRTDEVFVFGVQNTGYSDGSVDTFKIVMPTDATLELIAYTDSNGPQMLKVLDENKVQVSDCFAQLGNSKTTILKPLEKGTYYLTMGDYADGNYFVTGNLIFDSSTDAKVSSPKAGQLKVTAPKGCKVSGFEVRYKKSGDKSYKVKKIEGNKTLNTTISGLSKGKKYSVSVRKYITDSYGYTYYTDWTKTQSVTIKK